jgi:hypothetical protein
VIPDIIVLDLNMPELMELSFKNKKKTIIWNTFRL